MNKQIIAILLGIFFLSLASATTIYSGTTIYKDLTGEIENLQYFECNLTAQTYDLIGSNLTINTTGYVLSLDINFRPDNLTIVCLLNGEHYTSTPVYSSGGSSKKCYQAWNCSEWSTCNGYIQNRTCTSVLNCSAKSNQEKPNEINVCYERVVIDPEEPVEELEEPIEEPEEELYIPTWFEKQTPIGKVCILIILVAFIILVLVTIKYKLSQRKEKKVPLETLGGVGDEIIE